VIPSSPASHGCWTPNLTALSRSSSACARKDIYIRRIRPTKRPVYLKLHFAPGECAQVDWVPMEPSRWAIPQLKVGGAAARAAPPPLTLIGIRWLLRLEAELLLDPDIMDFSFGVHSGQLDQFRPFGDFASDELSEL
jgi:hypothetical protein